MSRTTVSHALSGKGRVDPETRAHVRSVADALGYRPSPRAQRLRTGKSGMVAIMSALPPEIVGEHSEMGFLLDMAMPAARALLVHGSSLVLVPPGASREHLDGLDVDGAIVIDPRTDDEYCRSLVARGVRVVTVGVAAGTGADAVLDRRASGGDRMLDHLVDQGARRIGVILSAEAHSVAAQLAEMIESHGRRWRGAEVIVTHADASAGETSGRAAAQELLVAHPDVDAIYAPLDAFAVGAVAAAVDVGRAIPGDLLVATNYDGPRAASCDPNLTVLDLHLAETALQAADLLTRVLSGEDVTTEVAPLPDVIPRASTQRGHVRA